MKNTADKKTKIVATLGPASEAPTTVRRLINAGVDLFRCNLSHGDHREHEKRIRTVRRETKRAGRHIGVLIDLCGPKIRIGEFEGGEAKLITGKTFILTTKKIVGSGARVFVNYKKLPREVRKGDAILLDDGKCRLIVTGVSKNEIKTKIEIGGTIRSRRGLSAPQSKLSISSISAKDKEDIKFAARTGADFVALSFVREAKDIVELRKLLKKSGSKAAIVAKIETRSALENADEILAETDAIMVARGDLAVETSVEEVPLAQKSLIGKANRAGKPVITATQMLETMIDSHVPTRAEVSDIANAILDGTDAIMLSGETALGEHPVEAVSVMQRVADKVEKDYLHRKLVMRRRNGEERVGTTDSVTSSAVAEADAVGARYIVAMTFNGKSARMLARHRPTQSIVAMTPNPHRARQLNLSFAVRPQVIKSPKHIDEVLEYVRKYFTKNRLAHKGERVVLVCGVPFGKAIATNMVLVEKI